MEIALVSVADNSGCPPIGLVYLASYLHEHTNHKATIIDSNYEDVFSHNYHNYDLVGISSMTVHYDRAIELAKRIDKPKVIGGVHISTCPESFNSCFDSMVLGEGEKAFINLLDDFQHKRLQKIYLAEQVSHLDNLAFPDWNLLDTRYFTEQLNTTFCDFGIEGWLLTSRGCPYRCVFCSTTRFWDKLRFHSKKYIERLIADLKKNTLRTYRYGTIYTQ